MYNHFVHSTVLFLLWEALFLIYCLVVCIVYLLDVLAHVMCLRKFQIPFQMGLSKMDLRKMLKSSLSGVSGYYLIFLLPGCEHAMEYIVASLIQVDKSISAMYKKLQKNLTSEELLPSLWDKCKVSLVFLKFSTSCSLWKPSVLLLHSVQSN